MATWLIALLLGIVLIYAGYATFKGFKGGGCAGCSGNCAHCKTQIKQDSSVLNDG